MQMAALSRRTIVVSIVTLLFVIHDETLNYAHKLLAGQNHALVIRLPRSRKHRM
jgi:hypothetical protein